MKIWELRKCGFKAEAERPISVQYGIERLEFKKKFRLPKKEQVSF
jgi:hypothetical protein